MNLADGEYALDWFKALRIQVVLGKWEEGTSVTRWVQTLSHEVHFSVCPTRSRLAGVGPTFSVTMVAAVLAPLIASWYVRGPCGSTLVSEIVRLFLFVPRKTLGNALRQWQRS